jgi:hypothetical protein
MRHLWILFLALCWAPAAYAADCDLLDHNRDIAGRGFQYEQRVLLADSDSGTGNSTDCDAPTQPRATTDQTWTFDYYVVWVDADDSCTSYTLQVRGVPETDATICEGACDYHVLDTLSSTGDTWKVFEGPLAESFDVNVTAISSCTVSVYLDFVYRARNR